ncbi:TetR/AcrR family transcriptional regulator (plasmid) [Sphingobium sp. SJ10-10]|uniref:TetR/AcrR family transcriptional regulator n=1 Tax=unclassified Sphingobium TaxID=2611147 RepID=UPI000B3C0E1F|nr:MULTISPECIES: TetR/AcrR family transcriptional regulator [Sphingomonadaceae]MEC6702147.1 TetR/AcrR family transcriptional regulator [Sphingobium sp. SJ10-10]NML90644.1 TetR/AcrR family transcriptional regulator [Sphingobium sp. TB-6]
MARKATETAAESTAAGTKTKTVAGRRAERQIATRRKILDAAARVIGRYGYVGCSVARVTAKARMAHGTFYLYFKSQQQLFDTILPTLGAEILTSIAAAIGDETDPIEIERLGFTANIAYTASHPYMNRVLYEAQLFAPKAYRRWLDGIAESYVRSFKRTLTSGPFASASDEQLHMLAIMIVNARTALLFRIDNKTAAQPDFVKETIETYLTFVTNGLGI